MSGNSVSVDVATKSSLIRREAAMSAFREFLLAFGLKGNDEMVANTPRRVVDAYIELLTSNDFQATVFPNTENYDELVMVRQIPFRSLCEHHFLPFVGSIDIAYAPGAEIVGLSKLARCVDHYASRPQLQERLTAQVADWVQDNLHPAGLGVVVRAQHMCMSLRGARADGASTVTTAFRGSLKSNPDERVAFYAMSRAG